MTMQRQQQGLGNKNIVKQMLDMSDGEVCFDIKAEHYVLKVAHMEQPSIFLILDDHHGMNSYQDGCKRTVRELFPGEYVTIKFSMVLPNQ
jgi:hypothetical protein